MPRKLETVDLDGVEIMKVGGPIFGVGSPAEGDFWTADDLRAMAAANAELASELKPAAFKGHDPKSGDPAVGWLENIRLNDAGDKLVTDLKKVPVEFADELKDGSYRTRSVELSKVVSQATGKAYDWVVTGLAWLGAKRPAVQGLADPVLYEGDAAVEVRARVEYATGDQVWDPEGGFQDLLSDIQDALNPGPGPTTYWVSDVSLDQTRAIVQDYDSGDAWVVPVTIDAATGDPTIGPSSDWLAAEQTWVAAAKEYEANRNEPRSDTRPTMPEKTYTDEQRRKFAEATGMDEAKATDEVLAAAGVLSETPPPAPEPPKPPEGDEPTRALEQQVSTLQTKIEKAEKRAFVAEMDADIIPCLKDGRITPGERESWERSYELNQEATRAALARLPKNEDLARTYGSDDETTTSEAEASERSYEQHAMATFGWTPEQLV